MSGQKKSYREMLRDTPYPQVSPEVFKINIDYHGLREYADSKGISISQMTDVEKDRFIINSSMSQLKKIAMQ